MKLSTKLQSPTLLVLQGFIAGAVAFFTLQPGADTAPPPPAAAPSVLADIQA